MSRTLSSPNAPVLCVGEALIDVVIRGQERAERVGGSPLNVACVIARQGSPAQIAAWWGKDSHGAMIEEYASRHGVEPIKGADAAEKTSLAFARLDASGQATYEFDLTWDLPALPLPAAVSHLHTGSIAATLEPGGTKVLEAARAMAAHGTTVSYDPNIRPALMGEPEAVRERIEEIIGLSDVVKASDEDISWLYGADASIEEVLERWLALGPTLAVVTHGGDGATVRLAGERDSLNLRPLATEVADTVGAGDSFMGGLLSGLLDADLIGSHEAKERLREARWADVLPALHRATITSGITVSHTGAYAPSREEVAAVITENPQLA